MRSFRNCIPHSYDYSDQIREIPKGSESRSMAVLKWKERTRFESEQLAGSRCREYANIKMNLENKTVWIIVLVITERLWWGDSEFGHCRFFGPFAISMLRPVLTNFWNVCCLAGNRFYKHCAWRRVSKWSFTGQPFWNLWSKKWYWDRCFFSDFQLSPASIIPLMLRTH